MWLAYSLIAYLLISCVVNPKFVAEQTRVPFDFAQGRLSTAIGAQNAPIAARDDSLFFCELQIQVTSRDFSHGSILWGAVDFGRGRER